MQLLSYALFGVMAGMMAETTAFSCSSPLRVGHAARNIAIRQSSGVAGLKGSMELSRREFFRDLLIVGASLALPSSALAVKARTGPTNVFTGEYTDPKHPGCKREIKVVGSVLGVDGKRSRLPSAIVIGRDSASGGACTGEATETAWKLKGTLKDEGGILIDFTPKGGPKDLLGKWDTDGIVFPDGNKWSKVIQ